MPNKKTLRILAAICVFLPGTIVATTLEFDDASTISVDGSCAKIQNSDGDAFVYNHEKSTLSTIDKAGNEYKLAETNEKQQELIQKTKRATQTGKQYTKFLPKKYQQKIKDLTRKKNKVKRLGTTVSGGPKAKKKPVRLKATGSQCTFEGIKGIGYDVVQGDATLGWFCGAQWRKVFAKPAWATLLGLRRLVTDISKVAGGKQANSSFAFNAFRIKAVPIAWNTETAAGQLADVYQQQDNPCQLTDP